MTTETTASTPMIGFDDEWLARASLTYLAEPSDERLGVLTETYGAARPVPGGQLARPGELIVPLLTARAPGLLALYRVGPRTAALLLIAAGDHPGRLRSEAAWAHLCAAAPIPASSGKVTRCRHCPAVTARPATPVADRVHPPGP